MYECKQVQKHPANICPVSLAQMPVELRIALITAQTWQRNTITSGIKQYLHRAPTKTRRHPCFDMAELRVHASANQNLLYEPGSRSVMSLQLSQQGNGIRELAAEKVKAVTGKINNHVETLE